MLYLRSSDLGAIHNLGSPIQIYPLYEAGFRAHRAQTPQENHAESAKLYAEFSKVASTQPYAWNHGKYDDEKVIGTVGKGNRMICSPCKSPYPYSRLQERILRDADPLLMNAFNTVNLSSAVILTSVSLAQKLGIPPSSWIYPLGGAGTSDSSEFWLRPNFHSSPSISKSLDAAFETSGLSKDDIDLFDIYSCFPIVPKLAAHHLGLPITGGKKALTLLGGLTSFGGAGNNYSMHAITAMTRALREGRGRNGLVLCNGGVLSYQYVIVLSKEPRRDAYPERNPLPELVEDVEQVEVAAEAEGEGIVEVSISPIKSVYVQL